MKNVNRRILLKLSGEHLMGDLNYGLDIQTVDRVAQQVVTAYNNNYEICIVIGGGNIFRGIGAAAYGMHRASADSVGMLATVMNSIAIQTAIESLGVQTRVLSAIEMPEICELYVRRKALRHIEKKRVVICAAGSGNPYFTTDTAAVLRSLELNCDILLKATKVKGIFTADPEKDPAARFMPKVSYKEFLEYNIKVMDQTAVILAGENKMPVVVFSIKEKDSLSNVLDGNGDFSVIS